MLCTTYNDRYASDEELPREVRRSTFVIHGFKVVGVPTDYMCEKCMTEKTWTHSLKHSKLEDVVKPHTYVDAVEHRQLQVEQCWTYSQERKTCTISITEKKGMSS